MLNFTEHIKRVSQLADQTLVDVQGKKYDSVREHLIKISINVNEAMQQLDEMTAVIQGDTGNCNPE
ncbi:hypothetical protein ES703_121635 [subsurface metagenome]